MPWAEKTRMSLREEMCTFAASGEYTARELARRFGVSRKTIHKWQTRYAAEGSAGLIDRSRRPLHSPRTTAAAMVDRVLVLRTDTGWGGRKLHHALTQEGLADVPSPSTITMILRRSGVTPATALAAPPMRWQRFEADAANDLWQLDFKAPVAVQGGTVSPLLVLDDYSRFIVGLMASPNQQSETVRAILTGLFTRYGVPARILADNGSPWASATHDAVPVPLTRLTVWLIRLGITISHGRPRHPQTQGKVERCLRTLGAEVLSRTACSTGPALQAVFDAWRDRYNDVRPHEALAHVPPRTRYHPSPRPLPRDLPPLLYAPGDELARVSAQGFIRLAHKRYFISQVIPGDPVAIRATEEEDIVEVWYGPQLVKLLDLQKPNEAFETVAKV